MLGDAIDAALPRLRAQVESMMGETVTIERLTGAVTTDPDTGDVVKVSETIYPATEGGKDIARVHGDRAYERPYDVATAVISTQRYLLSVPWDSGPFSEGDIVTVLASKRQPNLVGRQYRLGGPDERGNQTAQRMYIDVVA